MDPDPERSSVPTPAIPSFASLRDPGRRSPIDVLFPEEHPVPSEPKTPVALSASVAPRPPEWADLLHLAVHLADVVVSTSRRTALRWISEPVRRAKRSLGH